MKKWCFSTLIIILAVFGVCHQDASVANQEIVFQFTDHDTTSEEAQNVITAVKKQLLRIGVDNIKVGATQDGRLKISYYSDADVTSIEKMLSQEKELALRHNPSDQNKVPSDKNPNSYNLDVYEILDHSDVDWDIEGVHVVELKSKNHRLFNPDMSMSVTRLDERKRIASVAYKIHCTIVLTIDNRSHKIPEVRAGPSVLHNS